MVVVFDVPLCLFIFPVVLYKKKNYFLVYITLDRILTHCVKIEK